MNSTEAKQAVDRIQADLNAATKVWHDALIAESPIQPGDRVQIFEEALIVEYIGMWEKEKGWYVRCEYDGRPAYWPMEIATRIDEHGNPLGPRLDGLSGKCGAIGGSLRPLAMCMFPKGHPEHYHSSDGTRIENHKDGYYWITQPR